MKCPAYMNKGSKGPHVTVLQVFLVGSVSSVDPEFIFDGEYGERTSNFVKELQENFDTEVDGHFGPQTRQDVLEAFNVDFSALFEMVAGTTDFVQPDGSVVSWTSPKVA